MQTAFRTILPGFLVAIGLLLAGCGGGGGQSGSSSSSQPEMGQQSPSTQQPRSSPGQGAPGQAPGGQQQAPSLGQQSPSQAPSFSSEQIAAAGRIYAAVQKTRKQLQGGDQSRKQQMKQMQQSMQDAVAGEASLSGKQFQQLMRQVKQDPKLRKQFFQAVKEAGGQVPQPSGSGGR